MIRNRSVFPKTITRPILIYMAASEREDDRAYICYPNGRVEGMECGINGMGLGFTDGLALNSPGKGWPRVREVLQLRLKDRGPTEWNPLKFKGWRRLHWELL